MSLIFLIHLKIHLYEKDMQTSFVQSYHIQSYTYLLNVEQWFKRTCSGQWRCDHHAGLKDEADGVGVGVGVNVGVADSAVVGVVIEDGAVRTVGQTYTHWESRQKHASWSLHRLQRHRWW
jgi:hypothetical protein